MQIHVPNNYELYLESTEFDEIRQAVFARDNYKCVVCGDTENIQPHHLTYRNIYKENLQDLITLCRRCHATYHAVQKRADFVEGLYNKIDERKEQSALEARIEWAQEEEHRKELQKKIWNEIIEEYADLDYSKNGNLDMCDWNVLEEVINKKLKKYDLPWCGFNKSKLKDYFFGQRLKLLRRCLDKDISIENVISKTKLSEKFIRKWYSDKEKLDARIQQNDFLFKGDEFL